MSRANLACAPSVARGNAVWIAQVLMQLVLLLHSDHGLGEVRRAEPEKTAKTSAVRPRVAPVARGRLIEVRLLERSKQRQRIDFELELSPASSAMGPLSFLISPADGKQPSGAALGRIDLQRPKDSKDGTRKFDGRLLRFVRQQFLAETGKWRRSGVTNVQFWPAREHDAKRLVAKGYAAGSWHGRALGCRFDLLDEEVRFYFEGRLMARWRRSDANAGTSLVLRMDSRDRVRNLVVSSVARSGLFESVDLKHLAREVTGTAVRLPRGAVPFSLVQQGTRVLNLRLAQWVDEAEDPTDYVAATDAGPYVLNDARMPMLSVPKADYVAAYLLASAVEEPETSNTVALRVGRFGGRQQVLLRDHQVQVPIAGGSAFRVVRVPLNEAMAQDVLDDVLEVEVTKEVRLARHVPDPNRFQRRPLGLASGVRLAAVTFEKSPIQMRVTSGQAGNVFVAPLEPEFSVELSNITQVPQPFALTGSTTHRRGDRISVGEQGELAAGATKTVRLRLASVRRGYHDFEVELSGAERRLLLRRKTSFAWLLPDTRRHRHSSPFGTWEWHGSHVTPTDSDFVGSLYQKLGFRFGMSGHTPEARRKWGVSYGFEAKLDPSLEKYQRLLAKHPDLPKVVLQFHEESLSTRHAMRVPELFSGHPALQLNGEESEKYDSMLADTLQAAKLVREKYPELKISFGNGVPATKAEFFRRGLPAHAFDYAGNEAGCFQRLPEAQPPDFVALNASLWMDRQLLDAYGYRDKRVHQSYETCFPGDNPGNLSSAEQADYYVRHALQSLAWGMDYIHIGMLTDVGNSYYFSNWGAAGFLRAAPEVNVKPAFVAMATLTSVLDGAKFVRQLDAGSPSLYALEFVRPDQKYVLAFWTLRGRRELKAKQAGPDFSLVDDQGEVLSRPERVVATPAPQYLVGSGRITSVAVGAASYDDSPPPAASEVADFGKLDAWREVSESSQELEHYNFMAPRRKGTFAFEVSPSHEGRGPSLRVTPGPGGSDPVRTVPTYERLRLRRPARLPGQPNEIGVWINGNSGWGRVIFELVDASGQRWTSLGAERPGSEKPMSDWNTDDAYGLSFINFDGWRYVAFPLPGNYPGENHAWPANSNWRSSADGIVHYPLTLVGVAITLPSRVLQAKRWAPPPRREIYLASVACGSRQSWFE